MFPEALEEEQLEELDAMIKPIEQFFTEAGTPTRHQRSALRFFFN